MWKFKSAGFQPFVVQHKPSRLPVQQFCLVADLIDKDIYRTVIGALVQIVDDKPAQAIEALSHIGGEAVQLEPVRSTKCEHLYGDFDLDPVFATDQNGPDFLVGNNFYRNEMRWGPIGRYKCRL